MPRLRTFTLGALLAAVLTTTLALPGSAWSLRSSITTSTSTQAADPVELSATANTIAGPGGYTNDTVDPDQNVIYETFGVAADVCLTVQNRGQIGDVRTIVNGSEVGDRIKPRRTRSRCFTAPTSIELQCTSAICDAVWRIDAL